MANDVSSATVAAYRLDLGCSVCGSRDLAGACHHCGLPYCADHIPHVTLPWYRIDPEFRGLGLEKTEMGTAAIHCPFHRHARFNWRPFYWSAALLVMALAFPALFLFLQDGRPSATLLGLFLVAAGIFIFGFLADLVEDLRGAPPLPIVGRDPSLKIAEFVGGQVRLRPDGSYQIHTTSAAGLISVELAPTGAEEPRRDALRQRYSPIRLGRLQATAGFLALRGRAHLDFGDADGTEMERRPHVLALSRAAHDHPFFPLNGQEGLYRATPRYTFALDEPLPVHLIPALVSSEGGLGLELTVQLRTRQPKLFEGANAVVKELLLCAPEPLGPARSQRPATLDAPDDSDCSEHEGTAPIYWHGIPLLSGADSSLVTAQTSGCHRTFFVRFQNSERLPYSTFSGSLTLVLDNRLLSGIQDAVLFYPLGLRREQLAASYRTEIQVRFRLSLNGLRVDTPVERDVLRHYTGSVDYTDVLGLARMLDERGYYVKRLVEHAAGVTGRNHALFDHSWTIAGRYYQGIFPVGFELNISCTGEPRPAAGDEISVHIRVDAQVSRGDTLEIFRRATSELLTICDEQFAAPAALALAPAPRIRAALATRDHAVQSALDPAAGMPPGYGRERPGVDEPEQDT